MLVFAVYRLSPIAWELIGFSMSQLQWLSLVFSVVYMIYAEGYKGFHKAFAPRVVVRAHYLKHHPRLAHVVFAPLFCMGYIHATRKRVLTSIALTTMIIGFILLVRVLPQPWRGIVDAGVVAGLAVGIGSILYFLVQLIRDPAALKHSPEVPGELNAAALTAKTPDDVYSL